MKPVGRLCLVLHAHLPWVRRAEEPRLLEERWLHEAVAECYLPLLRMAERLAADASPARWALSISPVLIAQLEDPLLQERCARYLDSQVELAGKEVRRTRPDARFHPLARDFLSFYTQAREDYAARKRRLVPGFAALHRAGALELFTTAATHGYLPALRETPASVRAQLRLGLDAAERAFGFRPATFWLPECGYYPGLETELAAAGIAGTFLETHALTRGRPLPAGAPHTAARAGAVVVCARDPECSARVWSAQEGYPGHPDYREFHHDIGHTLDLDHLRPHLPGEGLRAHTGFKYWRVTGPTPDKQPYQPAAAAARAREHAADFLARLRAGPAAEAAGRGAAPLHLAPFDAELFGHWWFEGPSWLEHVLRGAAAAGLEARTPAEIRADAGAAPRTAPAESSWGEGGSHQSWVHDDAGEWIAPLHAAARQMEALARAHPARRAPPDVARAVRQAARHLLLAQASDWPFLLRAGTSADFARRTLRDQLSRFRYIEEALRAGRLPPEALAALEQLDPLFETLDYGVYA